MPYDEALVARIRPILAEKAPVNEVKMFGGVGFMVSGNMCCGVHKDHLILRLAPEMAQEALQQKDCRVFDITGRPMKGWVMAGPQAFNDDAFLKKWIGHCFDFVKTLPPK